MDNQEIFFMPLFFGKSNPNKAWVREVGGQNLTDIMVKVAVSPCVLHLGTLEIASIDVFSVSGPLPPVPMKNLLLSTVLRATQKRTGKNAQIANGATIIYGGKLI